MCCSGSILYCCSALALHTVLVVLLNPDVRCVWPAAANVVAEHIQQVSTLTKHTLTINTNRTIDHIKQKEHRHRPTTEGRRIDHNN